MNGKGKTNNKRNGGKRGNMDRRKNQRNERGRDTLGDDSRANYVRSVPDNDVAWYANSAQLLSDAASLAYSNPVGVPFDRLVDVPGPNIVDINYANLDYVPGVMSIGYIPTVGISLDNSSPINIAARNIYSYVRHANSGHANYDSPDLMLYILAMGNLYSMYAWMTRVYGVCQLYSQKNRVYPKGIVTAMNVDFDDILDNLANFRYYMNVVARKLNSLAVPTGMSYFDRQIWMNSNLFVDDPGSKAQTYLYNPDLVYRYSPVKYPTGGCLEPIKLGAAANPITFEDMRDITDSMLAAVIESEDMNIMSGDILKAFGSNIYTVREVAEGHTVLPVYSQEVLSQIQNATCNGWVHTNPNLDIKQNDVGALLYDPIFNGRDYVGKRLLNIYKDDVNPGDTMVATRLMNVARRQDEAADGTWSHKLDTAGSEIATTMKIYYPEFSSTDSQNGITVSNVWNHLDITYSEMIFDVSATEDYAGFYRTPMMLNWVSKFDFHPYITTFAKLNRNESDPGHDGAVYTYMGILGDIDNFTVVDAFTIQKMHETALLSEFAVPTMGTFANRK